MPDLGPDVRDEHGAPLTAPNGGEPGLSVTRIRELAAWYLDQAVSQHEREGNETGDVNSAELDAELRLILREEVAFSEHIEIEFERIMRIVFAV